MLIPLSEDEKLVLDKPREYLISAGQVQDWSEVTRIRPGERRTTSIQVRLEPGASGRMVRVFEVPAGSRLTIFHKVRLAQGASWQNAICIRGRGEVKIRRVLEVFGVGAKAQVMCLGMIEKTGRISVSDEMFTDAKDTQTDLCTKIVLKDAAHSEARGRILVGERAAGSHAYERLDHLLCGEAAKAEAIPELEVQTDDVQCGHGATTSQPDPEQLFYLMSRGFSAPAAERIIAQGFLAEALQKFMPARAPEALQILFA